ncbi:hypothetical protein ACH4OY_16870 [Micromonospora rubida]|uniref:Uncharacterized protein n=1 Tax=Micromonospora rubida TaxID=2697657 RepID=A0ABW7SNP1_9ACTN
MTRLRWARTIAAVTGWLTARPPTWREQIRAVAIDMCTNLQKLVELPKGVTFGSVECMKGRAGADPQGPNGGDGVYLFHYNAGTGWKYYGAGSGYDCKDLGLTEPAPFCIS